MTVTTTPPAFPPNPSVGDIYLNWVWNGSAWVCRAAGPVSLIKVLTTSQTYWPGPGTTFALVDVVGGGGGGGGALAQLTSVSASGWMCAGGGGASGGHSRSMINAALLVNGVIVTIGAGGAGGAGSPAAVGGAGDSTTFGALVVGLGGKGGQPSSTQGVGLSGEGGAYAGMGTGDLTGPGMSGFTGQNLYFTPAAGSGIVIGGKGGASAFAGSNINAYAYAAGPYFLNGYAGVYGSGGGGGASGLAADPATGGAGGAGLVVITEFAFGPNTVVQDCSGVTPVAAGMGVAVTEVPPGFQSPLVIGPRSAQWRARMPALTGPGGWR